MSITYTQKNSSSADASGDGLTVGLTSVAAGSLIAIFSKWEGGGDTTLSITGGDTFSYGTVNVYNSDLVGRWAYVLAHSGGTFTWTQDLGANRSFRKMHVWECAYTGTLSLAGEKNNSSAGSTAVTSGNYTTAGADQVNLCYYGEYSTAVFSSPLVYGVAADQSIINVPVNSYAASWLKVSAGTTGALSGTINGANEWVCGAISFSAAAGGVTGFGRPLAGSRNNPIGLV